MKTVEVRNLIEIGLDGAEIEVTDPQGTGDHFAATVVWSGFEDMSLIQQHQAVYKHSVTTSPGRFMRCS